MGALAEAWSESGPRVRWVVLRTLVTAALTLASPFLAMAFGLFLFGAAWPWVAAFAAVGGLVVLAGVVASLLLWSRLRRLVDAVAASGG